MKNITTLLTLILLIGCNSIQTNIEVDSVDTFNLDNYNDFYIKINESNVSAEINPIELERFKDNLKYALQERGLTYSADSNLTFDINLTTKDKIQSDRMNHYYSRYYWDRYMYRDDIRTITGKDFSLKYRQDRRWDGVDGDNLQRKLKLINCAKKLGLAQSPYISKSLDSKTQNKVLTQISKILPDCSPKEYCGKKTSVLTHKNIKNFSKRPYCGLVVPANSQRVILYATPESQFFIDETLLVMDLDFDSIESVFVLDGYLHKEKNILRYFPIDCVYHDGVLKLNYIHEEQKNSRLYYTIFMSKYLNDKNLNRNIKIENPESYISPNVSNYNRLLGEYETPLLFNEYIANMKDDIE